MRLTPEPCFAIAAPATGQTTLTAHFDRAQVLLGARLVAVSAELDGAAANRAAAERLFAAWERWDLDTIASLVAEDAVDTRPQSGERFVGRTKIMGMYREVPGPPRIRWRTVRGGPALWVAEGTVEYGQGPVNIVGIVELADGAVQQAAYYFAEPFDPPDERARWT